MTHTDLDVKTQLGCELIQDLRTHWENNEVKLDDEALWQIIRSASPDQWRQAIKAIVTLLMEGYTHKIWNTALCYETLKQLRDATKDPKWERVMSESFKGKSHPYKTQVWKVSRMAVELAETHAQ